MSDGRGATLAIATTLTFSFAECQKVVLLFGAARRRSQCHTLRLDELGLVPSPALHLSRRHRCAAFADLSSDKERFRIALAVALEGFGPD